MWKVSGWSVLQAGPGKDPSIQGLPLQDTLRHRRLTGGEFARLISFLHQDFNVMALTVLPVTQVHSQAALSSTAEPLSSFGNQHWSGDLLNSMFLLWETAWECVPSKAGIT